jgi:hypothetical protein
VPHEPTPEYVEVEEIEPPETTALSIEVRWSDGVVQQWARRPNGSWMLRIRWDGQQSDGLRITGYDREEMYRVLDKVLEGTP